MAAKKSAKRAPAKKKPAAKKPAAKKTPAKSQGTWQLETLDRLRRLIREADPDVVEERKWKKPSNPEGVATWSHDGILFTGELYKEHVKLNFARGASLKDPARLFNAGFDGNARRAIHLKEGETVDEAAFKELVREAVALNASG